MSLTAKRKAFVFAALLLLVSTAFLVTAAASTNSALRPFLQGEAYGRERALTRGHFVPLGVRVGQVVGEEIQPVTGAQVSVARLGAAAPEVNRTVATQSTDEKGQAVFELRPGTYILAVTSGPLVASYKTTLHEPTRLSVSFDSEGQAHWLQSDHRELERRGEMMGVLVRVGQNASGHREPVANATVQVFRINPEDESTELIDEKQTGPRGFASFHLHRGHYRIHLIAGDVSSDHDVGLRGPRAVQAFIDGSDVEWREGDGHAVRHRADARDPDDHGSHRR